MRMLEDFFCQKINKMKNIEHIGIAVRDLESSVELFSKLLNIPPYKSEKVESEGVETTFFKTGETKVELLSATNEDSPIAKFLEKKGEGIHHIAFEVADLDAEIKRLEKEGFKLINQASKDGADNKKIAFLHPKSTNGVLIEICQEKEK